MSSFIYRASWLLLFKEEYSSTWQNQSTIWDVKSRQTKKKIQFCCGMVRFMLMRIHKNLRHTLSKMYLVSILKLNTFKYVCMIMLMSYCNVQTHKHGHRAIMYTIICIRLHSNEIHKSSIPGIYIYQTGSIWWYNHLRHTKTYDNNWNMRYRYILSIT